METQKTSGIVSFSEPRIKPVAGDRILFIDNIRWLMIIFVVLIHLNCTYGNIGMWYYKEVRNIDFFPLRFSG